MLILRILDLLSRFDSYYLVGIVQIEALGAFSIAGAFSAISFFHHGFLSMTQFIPPICPENP